MMALALAGSLLYLRGRMAWAALLFAATLLTREVAVLFLVPAIVIDAAGRRWRRALALLLSVGPYLAWQAVLARAYGQSGAAMSRGQFGPPLAGIAATLRIAPHAAGHKTYWALVVAVVVFVGAALVVSIVYAYRRRDVVTGGVLAHAVAALFAGPAIWLGFDGVARVFGGLYPLTVFAFVRYRGRPLALLVGGVVLLSALALPRVATATAAPYYLTP